MLPQLQCRSQLWLGFNPWPGNFHMLQGSCGCEKRKKKEKKKKECSVVHSTRREAWAQREDDSPSLGASRKASCRR